MNPLTNKLLPLTGRKNALPGHDASVNLGGSDYSGPADGDFARYVDQLLSNADVQRRLQMRAAPDARAPSAASASGDKARGNARGNAQAPRQTVKPAAAAKVSTRAAAEAAKAALPKIKPFSIGLWLMAIVATIFFPSLAIWFVAAIVVNSVIKGVRRGLGKG